MTARTPVSLLGRHSRTYSSPTKARPTTLLVVCLLAAVVLAGCGSGGFSGLYNAPLPGGASLGSHPYRVTALFGDVLDLVPQSSVKVNDVPVGRVDSIGLRPDNTTAAVSMLVNGDVSLPANATAQLRQSSLLGEKYVELAAPTDTPATGTLTGGATIPLARTNRNPEVEEVLGALSLLLNGGGVAQLQTITRELNKAMSGNEQQLRSLLSDLNNVATQLDTQKQNITAALDGLNRLSDTLRAQSGNITAALRDLGPGIQVIDQERNQLVTMLQSLDKLSGVAVRTINASRDGMVADLNSLQPILTKLAEAGTDLPVAIGYLASYPFPDYALHPLKGDFFNADVQFNLDLSGLVDTITHSSGTLLPIAGVNDGDQQQPTAPGSGLPALPLQSVPTTSPAPPPAPTPGGSGGGLLGNLLGGG